MSTAVASETSIMLPQKNDRRQTVDNAMRCYRGGYHVVLRHTFLSFRPVSIVYSLHACLCNASLKIARKLRCVHLVTAKLLQVPSHPLLRFPSYTIPMNLNRQIKKMA